MHKDNNEVPWSAVRGIEVNGLLLIPAAFRTYFSWNFGIERCVFPFPYRYGLQQPDRRRASLVPAHRVVSDPLAPSQLGRVQSEELAQAPADLPGKPHRFTWTVLGSEH